MLNRIKWVALLATLMLLLAACGGDSGDIPASDIVSTLAAQTAEVALTETVLAGGSLATPTQLPVPTDTPAPEPTDDNAVVPTNALDVAPTADDTGDDSSNDSTDTGDTTTDPTATAVLALAPTATAITTSGGSSICDWTATYESEDPPFDGSKFIIEKKVEKTWYVKNTSRDSAGNGCAWTRTSVVLRWVGTYRSEKAINWAALSEADKAEYKYVNDFGSNLTAFVTDSSVPYLTKIPITLTLKMPNKPGYYRVEWLIFGPDSDPVYIDGGALWIELRVYGQGG